MSSPDPHHNDTGGAHERFDEEIRFGTTLKVGIGLALLAVVSAIAMYGMFHLLASRAASRDVVPTPLVLEGQAQKPPAPRLQENPELELSQIYAEERTLLEGYSWVDEESGIARIPVEAAMDLIAANPALADPLEPQATGADAEQPVGGTR